MSACSGHNQRSHRGEAVEAKRYGYKARRPWEEPWSTQVGDEALIQDFEVKLARAQYRRRDPLERAYIETCAGLMRPWPFLEDDALP